MFDYFTAGINMLQMLVAVFLVDAKRIRFIVIDNQIQYVNNVCHIHQYSVKVVILHWQNLLTVFLVFSLFFYLQKKFFGS